MSFDFDSLSRKPQSKSSQKTTPKFNFGDAQPSPSPSPASSPEPGPGSPPSVQVFQEVSFNSPSNSSVRVQSSTKTVHKPGSSRSKTAASHKSGTANKRSKGQKGLDNQTIILAAGGGILLLVIVIAFMSFGGAATASRPGQMSVAQERQKSQYLQQAMNYNNSGNYQQAAVAFKKAYEIDPFDGYAATQLAIIYRTKINDPAQLQIWEKRNEQIVTGAVNRLEGQSANYWDKKNKR